MKQSLEAGHERGVVLNGKVEPIVSLGIGQSVLGGVVEASHLLVHHRGEGLDERDGYFEGEVVRGDGLDATYRVSGGGGSEGILVTEKEEGSGRVGGKGGMEEEGGRRERSVPKVM
jgi:hypothetical protein